MSAYAHRLSVRAQSADSTYTLAVTAIDTAENASSIARVEVTLDTAPPETLVSGGPSSLSSSRSATLFMSSEGGTAFECRLDGGTWNPCVSGVSYASLSDGLRTFEGRAIDAAGNRDPTPDTYTWKIDATGPQIQITSVTVQASGSLQLRYSVFFEASDPAGVSSTECRLGNDPYRSCVSGWAWNGDLRGEIAWVRAEDGLGNVREARWPPLFQIFERSPF